MKNYQDKIRKVIFSVLFVLVLFGCVSKQKTAPAILIKHPERMFWEIQRGDASIFVLGTIHVADDKFFPLEEQVLKAFDSADVLVSEVGRLDMEELTAKMQAKMLKSLNLDKSKNLSGFLSPEEINVINRELGEQGKSLFMFNPWVLTLVINEQIIAKTGLKVDSGIDLYLMGRAGNRKIEALESIDSQIELLSKGTFDEQIELLHGAIEEINDTQKTVATFQKLTALYLADNREELGKMIMETEIPEGVSAKTYKAHTETMFLNRNIAWAKQFEKYLNDGGKTFVFAGAGHFVGKGNVFEQMYKNGTLKYLK